MFHYVCHVTHQMLKKKVKVIHLLRNPKDSFVSLYCHLSKMKGLMHYGGTWDHFFATMLDMGCEYVFFPFMADMDLRLMMTL